MSVHLCKTCPFWVEIKRPQDKPPHHVGSCHRYPPTWPTKPDRGSSPIVGAGHWCGEHPQNFKLFKREE